jgi:hypothetical protein
VVGHGRPICSCHDGPIVVNQAYLTEPRRAREIARYIGRSGCCTTGHLRYFLRRALVVRIERGVYALARRQHGQGQRTRPVSSDPNRTFG